MSHPLAPDPTKSFIGQLLGNIFTLGVLLLLAWIILFLGWLICRIITAILPGFRPIPRNWKELFRCGFIGFSLVAVWQVPWVAVALYPLLLIMLYMIGQKYAEEGTPPASYSYVVEPAPAPAPVAPAPVRAKPAKPSRYEQAIEAIDRACWWDTLDNETKYAMTGNRKYLKRK